MKDIVYFIVAQELPTNYYYIFSADCGWGVPDEKATFFATPEEAKKHRCPSLPSGKKWNKCIATYDTVNKRMVRLD